MAMGYGKGVSRGAKKAPKVKIPRAGKKRTGLPPLMERGKKK